MFAFSFSNFEVVTAPCIHQQLLVRSDRLLLKLSRWVDTAHKFNDLHFKIELLKELTAEGEVFGEFTQVEAGDSFFLVRGCFVFDYLNKDLDKFKVIFIMEGKEVLLPELLSMNGAPSEAATLANFFLKFVNRRESFLVLVKELKKLVEKVIDIRVNPVSILKLNDCVKNANVRHDFVASLACVLQIVEKKQDNPHNLFFIEVVEDLDSFFNDTKVKVFESLKSKFMIGWYP